MTSCIRAFQQKLHDSQKEEIFTLLSTGGCLLDNCTCENFLLLQVFTDNVSHNSWLKGLKAPQTSCETIFLHKHRLHTGAHLPAHTTVFGACLVYHHKPAHNGVESELGKHPLRSPNKGPLSV